MPPHLPYRRQSIAALLAAIALASLASGSPALGQATSSTGATSTSSPIAGSAPATSSTTTTDAVPAKPKLSLSWTMLTHRCWTATKIIKVKTKKRVKIRGKTRTKTVTRRVKRWVRRCGERPSKAEGRTLHLRWRQHGEVFGHLTLAGQPIPNAVISIESAIPKRQTTSTNVISNARGRFSAPITGPNKRITLTYSPGPGTEIVATKKVLATAHLSLKVGRLHAGRRARFSGILFGGHIPQDLYIQFWYYAGPTGWQPFSHLAIVARHNGHWSTGVPIPADSRGYRYEIKATVVASPYWPWAHTESRVITRIVS